jgi:hypothetical protein
VAKASTLHPAAIVQRKSDLTTEDEPDATAELVVDLVARRIPAKFGCSPRDIQV